MIDGLVGVWEVLRRPGERLGDTLDRVGSAAFAAHVASIASGFAPGDDPETPAAAVSAAID